MGLIFGGASHRSLAGLVFTDPLLFEAAVGSTQTEDFESFPLNAEGFGAISNGQSLGAFSASSLVIFSDIDLLKINLDDTGLDGTFLVDGVGSNTFVRPGGQGNAGTDRDNDDFRIEFANPVAAAGLTILDNQSEDEESITFLDAAGLAIMGGTLDSLPNGFIGFVTTPGDPLIAAIEIHEGAELNDDIGFDDVTFANAAAPEPSSLVLTLFGVAVLGGLRRRRHRRNRSAQ